MIAKCKVNLKSSSVHPSSTSTTPIDIFEGSNPKVCFLTHWTVQSRIITKVFGGHISCLLFGHRELRKTVLFTLLLLEALKISVKMDPHSQVFRRQDTLYLAHPSLKKIRRNCKIWTCGSINTMLNNHLTMARKKLITNLSLKNPNEFIFFLSYLH